MEISGVTSDALLKTQLNKQQSVETGAFQATLDAAMESKDKAQIKKACVEFESYFINMMFKEMRKSVDSSGGIFPKSYAEEIFQEMLDEKVADSAANGNGIGLADMMYRQMEKNI